mgnify:CR=1 FL=1
MQATSPSHRRASTTPHHTPPLSSQVTFPLLWPATPLSTTTPNTVCLAFIQLYFFVLHCDTVNISLLQAHPLPRIPRHTASHFLHHHHNQASRKIVCEMQILCHINQLSARLHSRGQPMPYMIDIRPPLVLVNLLCSSVSLVLSWAHVQGDTVPPNLFWCYAGTKTGSKPEVADLLFTAKVSLLLVGVTIAAKSLYAQRPSKALPRSPSPSSALRRWAFYVET